MSALACHKGSREWQGQACQAWIPSPRESLHAVIWTVADILTGKQASRVPLSLLLLLLLLWFCCRLLGRAKDFQL